MDDPQDLFDISESEIERFKSLPKSEQDALREAHRKGMNEELLKGNWRLSHPRCANCGAFAKTRVQRDVYNDWYRERLECVRCGSEYKEK